MSERTRVDRAAFGAQRGPVDRAGDLAEPVLAGQLRHAFAAGELTAYYQPQYDIQSMDVVALEALCRWEHPTDGLLLPARFIYMAERYGLIADVGHAMLEEAGPQVAAWHARGLPIGLSLNVSPSELSIAFAENVLRRLRELGLGRHVVTLEITEAPVIEYSRERMRALEALIDGGVGVSIDDFGTVNTSLDLVRVLPITEVKIDKSLMRNPDPAIDDVVRECVDVARARGAAVVAEGIESEQHFARAVQWRCDRAQGFYFAPPLPMPMAQELLLTVNWGGRG